MRHYKVFSTVPLVSGCVVFCSLSLVVLIRFVCGGVGLVVKL